MLFPRLSQVVACCSALDPGIRRALDEDADLCVTTPGQLPAELVYLGGTCRILSQALLGRGQGSVQGYVPGGCDFLAPSQTKKADVVEHLEVFDHVGLLVNEPPGTAGLPFS